MQKYVHLVALFKSFPTTIYLQKSAPRVWTASPGDLVGFGARLLLHLALRGLDPGEALASELSLADHVVPGPPLLLHEEADGVERLLLRVVLRIRGSRKLHDLHCRPQRRCMLPLTHSCAYPQSFVRTEICLRSNSRSKALDEIYQIAILLHFSILNIPIC